MRSDWLGDSYDIVKKFFIGELQSLGYSVYVDPMGTGEWRSSEAAFLNLLGAAHVRDVGRAASSALLLDPNTGIGVRRSRNHTTIAEISIRLDEHDIVFVFDQSISRGSEARPQLEKKLSELAEVGAVGFYYDSHAKFLFASRSSPKIHALRDALLKAGLPDRRLLALNSHAA